MTRTIIRPVRFLTKPIRLRGLDGTEMIGIPRLPLRVEGFEELYDKFRLEASKGLKAEGKELLLVTIPEYLRECEIREVEEMLVFRDTGPEEGLTAQAY